MEIDWDQAEKMHLVPLGALSPTIMGTLTVAVPALDYRAMAAVAPTSYDDCTVKVLRSERDEALALLAELRAATPDDIGLLRCRLEHETKVLRSALDDLVASENDRDSWASKCGEATERAWRAERLLEEAEDIKGEMASIVDVLKAATVCERNEFIASAVSRVVAERDNALKRLAERDASLVRATGKR